MNRSPHCSGESIAKFLDDSQSESMSRAELQALEGHLSQCLRCQTLFEESLAAFSIDPDSSRWLAEANELAPELLKHGEVDAKSTHKKLDRDPLQRDRDAILEMAKRLLPPSDNPAMLGKLGEFEILEPLGAGGMGIVFKGYDHELNRYVAVKMLSPSLSTAGAAKQRFLREAQAAATIVHPHVVPIHAISSEGQIPFLVMSYIPGENLQEHLAQRGALPPAEALRIAHQVALGLAAAHQHGVIHRDVKPANILLERNVQRVLLTDFGLARAADDASLTRSGLVSGTPNYMSPEQARGEQVDARSDLFGLGCILYAMLAGHPPFRGEHAYAVLRRLMEEQPRSLTEIQPQIPRWLDQLVLKLLAKDPSQRFQSAEEVAHLLQACHLHLGQPEIHPIPEACKPARAVRPNRSIRIVLATACLMVFLLGAVLGFVKSFSSKSFSREQPSNNAAEVIALETEQALGYREIESLLSHWREEDSSSIELQKIKQAVKQLESSEK